MFVRCPFCHKNVFRWFYRWHEAKHLRKRDDGQHQDHVTAPPEERYEGSLEGIPQNYRHPKCGVVTGMPEEIIRTYLVNPFSYCDGSFCCGCGGYVCTAELFWVETGECVMDYAGRRRLEYLRRELGMDLPDRPTKLVVTDAAIRYLRAIYAKVGLRNESIVLIPADPFDGEFKFSLDDGTNAKELFKVRVWEMDFAIPIKHAGHFPGLAIHSLNGALSISRLYAPKSRKMTSAEKKTT